MRMVTMAAQYNNLQDHFLNIARKDKIEINIYLVNGVPIKGRVLSFDNFTILLEVDKKHNLIYKHAMSTIVPSRPIPYKDEEENKKIPRDQ
jgi:host factor-I protein